MNTANPEINCVQSSRYSTIISIVISILIFLLGVTLGLNVSTFGRYKQFVKSNNIKYPVTNEDIHVTRMLPEIPKGPPTDLHLHYSNPTINYTLIYNTQNAYMNYGNESQFEIMRLGKAAQFIKDSWLTKSAKFRSLLSRENLNTVDRDANSRVPFLTNLSIEKDILNHTLNCKSISCAEIAMCDTTRRPVVDIALVAEMDLQQPESIWGFLESISQLTVYPKEIIVIIGETDIKPNIQMTALLRIIEEEYKQYLPPILNFSIYATDVGTSPGENRWFGFNQTTAQIVAAFNGDDYIHPQFFHIFWRIFSKRQELDYALMSYGGCTAVDKCSDEMFFLPIINFLKTRLTENDVVDRVNFPMSFYEELWAMIPTFDKIWWLGNTDAEPNWGIGDQHWHDYGCHNGWSVFRRHVMKLIPPPVGMNKGQDAIWNYRIARAKFNYQCTHLLMGCIMTNACRKD